METKVDAWFSDDPDGNASNFLGRGGFNRRLIAILEDARQIESSSVFGLVGPWGSGKSSVLQWVESTLASTGSDPAWTVMHFSPWDYQSTGDAQLGFFAELESAFPTTRLEKARKAVAQFSYAVAPFSTALGLLGIDPSTAIEATGRMLDGDKGASATRRKLEEALLEARRPILIIIDDVDRITADELLLTLKLVRNLGRLPYVHYLIAYDESTLLDVLSRTDLIGESSRSRARDYMEKVVQIRFDLPSLRPDDALRLVNEGLATLARIMGKDFSDAEASRYSSAYFDFLKSRLRTPRAIRRYFAHARLMSAAMRPEIDYADFLVLTWLRASDAEVYSLIQSERDELLGELTSKFSWSQKEDERRERKSDWREALLRAGVRTTDIESVAAALGFLFPRFAAMWNGHGSSGGRTEPGRVAHRDYFDRFFSFSIVDGDIEDSKVADALHAVNNNAGNAQELVDVVLRALQSNPGLVISKVVDALSLIERWSPPLFAWLLELAASTPRSDDLIEPAQQIKQVASKKLRALDLTGLDQTIRAMANTNHALPLAEVVERAVRASQHEERAPIVLDEKHRHLLAEKFSAALDGIDPWAPSAPEQGLFWRWVRLDQHGATVWLDRLRVAYDDLAALSMFVSCATALGTANPISRIQGVELTEAARFLDLPAIRSKFSDELERDDEVIPDQFEGSVDTPSARRSIVLTSLKNFESSTNEKLDNA